MSKNEKKTQKKPEVNVKAMVDELVDRSHRALEEMIKFDQEQVDKIVKAMTLAGIDNHMRLAKLAIQETNRGIYEDKIIKIYSPQNMYITV